jgi:hypothetical protein
MKEKRPNLMREITQSPNLLLSYSMNYQNGQVQRKKTISPDYTAKFVGFLPLYFRRV